MADITPDRTSLDEASAAAATEGTNDFGRVGYGGPCPPRGHGAHRDRFHLHALKQSLQLGRGFSRDEMDRALKGHVIATAMLMGVYERGHR